MNKLMYRFVAATKKKRRKNRPLFRNGMPPQGIPRKKNPPVFRHGMPPQGIPRKEKKKEIDPFLDTVCPTGHPA